jgi:hypothetical protein
MFRIKGTGTMNLVLLGRNVGVRIPDLPNSQVEPQRDFKKYKIEF